MNGKNKQWILSFLQIIKVDGNINFLMNEEYSFLKFTRTMHQLKKEGYIRIEGDKTLLTDKGERLYNQLCRDLGKRGLYRFIMPDLRSQFPPMALDDIYVPKKKNMKKEKNGDVFSS